VIEKSWTARNQAPETTPMKIAFPFHNIHHVMVETIVALFLSLSVSSGYAARMLSSSTDPQMLCMVGLFKAVGNEDSHVFQWENVDCCLTIASISGRDCHSLISIVPRCVSAGGDAQARGRTGSQ
jgi:hypothetical protein